jgi:hypothetical protein
MPHARSHTRKKTPKRVLALPDLEHAKSAVLSSLTSRSGQRTYDHAIREFAAWYRSEPRDAGHAHRLRVAPGRIAGARSSFSSAASPSQQRSGTLDVSRSSGAP